MDGGFVAGPGSVNTGPVREPYDAQAFQESCSPDHRKHGDFGQLYGNTAGDVRSLATPQRKRPGEGHGEDALSSVKRLACGSEPGSALPKGVSSRDRPHQTANGACAASTQGKPTEPISNFQDDFCRAIGQPAGVPGTAAAAVAAAAASAAALGSESALPTAQRVQAPSYLYADGQAGRDETGSADITCAEKSHNTQMEGCTVLPQHRGAGPGAGPGAMLVTPTSGWGTKVVVPGEVRTVALSDSDSEPPVPLSDSD